MNMHSIRARIATLTVVAIIISSLLIGITSIITVKTEEESTSSNQMIMICDSRCEIINEFLNSIQDSLETVSRYIYDSLDVKPLYEGDVIGAEGSGRSLKGRDRTDEQQEALEAYLSEHVNKVEAIFRTVASGNSGILNFSYRLNPELSDNVPGFWYSRQNTAKFQNYEPMSIWNFSPDDYTNVGWYYTTLERSRPSWLESYPINELDVVVCTYTIPIFRAGTFIGLISMDFDYSTLIDQVKNLDVLNTGYAFLTDSEGVIVYHPSLEAGLTLSNLKSEFESSEYKSNSTGFIEYTYNGQNRYAAFGALSNGLRLVVSAPESEINSGWRDLTKIIVGASTLILIAFIGISMIIMKRIINPLDKLVQASAQLSAGNYDVDLNYNGDDEVGALTKAFTQMAEHLRAFIKDLNSRAYKDALTGVRNKAAFDIFTYEMFDQNNAAEGRYAKDFAIAMFDCNELKRINDTYGHEKGDIYICNGCNAICNVFSHSPVFRIGGDEFAVILQGEDLAKSESLEKQFTKLTEESVNGSVDEWEKISVAIGIARYDPEIDPDFESVLRRADEIMYINKKLFKESRGILTE